MGRICPILNHPLNDGVLINDKAVVNFIQKRNVDFLPQEYVCRSCKREIEKLYKKKLKKAIELHRSRYHDGSISTLKTSRDSTSSAASTTSEHSVAQKGIKRKLDDVDGLMLNGKNNSLTETSLRQHNISQRNPIVGNDNNKENQHSLVNVQNNNAFNLGVKSADNAYKNVTVRKRTIKDFYTPKPVNGQEKTQANMQTELNKANGEDDVIRRFSQEPTTSKTATAAAASNLNSSELNIPKKVLTRHVTSDMEQENNEADDDDVIRRLSQEPTTSRAATTAINSKRQRTSYDDDDDMELSLNAYNGTRLPHIQPILPKRRSTTDKPKTMGRDIMDEYIKDITGG